jgi:hypothetical protein
MNVPWQWFELFDYQSERVGGKDCEWLHHIEGED